jgi:hypothetical protein
LPAIPALAPLIEIAKQEIDAGLHHPAETMTSKEFDDCFGVRRQIAEILVQDQDEVDAMLGVETQGAVNRVERDGLGLRSEGCRLAKRATEAAATRRKENANRNAPAARKPEFRNQRWVLNLLQRGAKQLR